MAEYFSKWFNGSATGYVSGNYTTYAGLSSAARFYSVDNGDGETVSVFLRVHLYTAGKVNNNTFSSQGRVYLARYDSDTGFYIFWSTNGTGPGSSSTGYGAVMQNSMAYPASGTAAGWHSSQWLASSENQGVDFWPSGLPIGTYNYGAALPRYRYRIFFPNLFSGYFDTNGAYAPCKLTYNANGGTVSDSYKIIVDGNEYGTLPEPTRLGYIFLGWFTDADGGTEVTSSTIMGTSNTTIYAHWRPAGFTMYDSNGIPHVSLVTMYDNSGSGHNVLISMYDGNGTRRDVR